MIHTLSGVSVSFVYVVGGVAFNKFYRKQEGVTNILPNYAFWAELPGS